MLDTVVALCNTAGLTSPYGKEVCGSNGREIVGTFFGKENKLRRLMLLLALLAATMLVASPVLAHPGGPTHGNKYSKNYYPTSYFKYCEPAGAKYYGKKKASNNSWCDKYYKKYTKKTFHGKNWYYVHVYYKWKTPDGQGIRRATGITASTTSTMTRTPRSPISR